MMDEKIKGETGSKTLKVYDPAMCCATGICGPNVDSTLVEFAGAVKTASEQGIVVERFNLAQQPQAFVQNLQVKKHLAELGHTKLPFIYIDDELRSTGRYPTAKELLAFLGLGGKEVPEINPGIKDTNPFVVLGASDENGNTGGCCPEGGCCS
jgi:hypothetical protein